MTGWRLLLTRPAAENAALSTALAAAGVFSSSLPLLEIEALAPTPEQRALLADLGRYNALIVVSKPAARLGLELIQQVWPQPPAGQCWFSVGAGTAQLLDAYLTPHGLAACYPASGDDSEALLALPQLRQALAGAAPRVLILRGEGGRELLAETLRERGVMVDYLQLYRRVLPSYPADALLQRVRGEQLNALLVSSAQGLEHLCQLAGDAWPELARLPLLVPSPRVAELARAAGARQPIDCRGVHAAAVLTALGASPAPTL
ncbi:uroporphyrinogen-III synthase [Pseudomonas alcaligenes]|uniref:Uroporphyrinogen-III synthase n=2 Tax=Pseudomonadaceae TaxID=135621 RepID=A0A1V0M084_ECTOL|nr:uroporphyrinogen-III synthase [Pseudomonas alcaligenes]ARD68210.1 Phorphyrin biosynthesis protein [Pseudomonas oleovorans]MBC9252779.1 uroporphyrinogen-III synthase [Pseudomonas alcaligenes]